MKSKYNKLTCLFGHHQYGKKLTRDKDGHLTHLCKICERSGYYKYSDGEEVWSDYNNEGNCIHDKWSSEIERWLRYDKNGVHVHTKCDDGVEYWKNNSRHWVMKKPKNWKYEKDLQ